MNSPAELIKKIRQETKTIAVVGASPKAERPSYGVMKFLIDQSYSVYPINPGQAGQLIHGRTVYACLSDVPEAVDMVDIFRRSDQVGPIVDEALTIGVKTVWMQLGVINQDAAAKAETAGIQVIMDHCPAIEWR